MTSVCVRVCMCAIIAILLMQGLSDDAADELVQLLVGGILYPWLRGRPNAGPSFCYESTACMH